MRENSEMGGKLMRRWAWYMPRRRIPNEQCMAQIQLGRAGYQNHRFHRHFNFSATIISSKADNFRAVAALFILRQYAVHHPIIPNTHESWPKRCQSPHSGRARLCAGHSRAQRLQAASAALKTSQLLVKSKKRTTSGKKKCFSRGGGFSFVPGPRQNFFFIS